MTSSPEDKLGALGDMDMVIKFKGDDDYLVLGGDNFYQDSLAGFVQGAKEKSPFVSIGVSDIHDRKKARSYGVVDLDDTSRITRFEEKPPVPHSSFVAMCLYYFPREKIPLFKEYFSNPLHSRDAMGMFIQWLVSRDRVFGFLFEHLWADIGQLETYRHLQETLARGE